MIVGAPRSFAAVSQGEQGLLLVQIPLVFYNDGAAAQIVQNLRLSLEQNEVRAEILYFNNTLSNLASNDDREWARQFAIGKRSSYSSIFVFQRRPGHFVFSEGVCRAILEARLNDSVEWKTLLDFNLQTPAQSLESLNGGPLIAHDNDPDREWAR